MEMGYRKICQKQICILNAPKTNWRPFLISHLSKTTELYAYLLSTPPATFRNNWYSGQTQPTIIGRPELSTSFLQTEWQWFFSSQMLKDGSSCCTMLLDQPIIFTRLNNPFSSLNTELWCSFHCSCLCSWKWRTFYIGHCTIMTADFRREKWASLLNGAVSQIRSFQWDILCDLGKCGLHRCYSGMWRWPTYWGPWGHLGCLLSIQFILSICWDFFIWLLFDPMTYLTR